MELKTDPSPTESVIHQQELERYLGIEGRRVLCAPASLLNLANINGYSIEPYNYADNLDWGAWSKSHNSWSRAKLSTMLRSPYGAKAISWWSAKTGSLIDTNSKTRMIESGYLSQDPSEIAFVDHTISRVREGFEGIIDIVDLGHPAAVTMLPGFAKNKALHAVILKSISREDATVEIIDPDDTNTNNLYPVNHILKYIHPLGACTVLLPKDRELS